MASFHNTLGERMIPSTRPMMLQAALDLSNLVQDQKAVYWDDVEQLSNYTEKLKKIVLKLETQVLSVNHSYRSSFISKNGMEIDTFKHTISVKVIFNLTRLLILFKVSVWI